MGGKGGAPDIILMVSTHSPSYILSFFFFGFLGKSVEICLLILFLVLGLVLLCLIMCSAVQGERGGGGGE